VSVLPAFAHSRPETVEEAIALLSDDSLPYAGGTELLLAMRAGFLQPERLVDLKRISGLDVIEMTNSALLIGAGVTHWEAARSPAVAGEFPMLAAVLDTVGNARVRATGTLAGNLCFAEPKSDVATALIALDAHVTLRSAHGPRKVPVEEFIIGPYTTVRTAEELLTEISIPLRVTRAAAYEKYQTMERPTVGVAAAVSSERARLVVGAVGPVPQVFDAAAIGEFDPAAVAASLEIIPDLTGEDDYKRHVARLSIAKVLSKVAGQ
jgi:carbon-monoxide dehydrogenase medium subunit